MVNLIETKCSRHILIDEGAQTREPETIAPLSLCGPKTVIAIVGDHRLAVTDAFANGHALSLCMSSLPISAHGQARGLAPSSLSVTAASVLLITSASSVK